MQVKIIIILGLRYHAPAIDLSLLSSCEQRVQRVLSAAHALVLVGRVTPVVAFTNEASVEAVCLTWDFHELISLEPLSTKWHNFCSKVKNTKLSNQLLSIAEAQAISNCAHQGTLSGC